MTMTTTDRFILNLAMLAITIAPAVSVLLIGMVTL